MNVLLVISLSTLVLNSRDRHEKYGFLIKMCLESNLTTTFSFKILPLNLLVLGVKQYGSSPYCILPSSVLQYVTKFAKRGLIHASTFLTIRMCNSASVGPTALKVGGRPFLSLY